MKERRAEGKIFVKALLKWLNEPGNQLPRKTDIVKSITSLVPYPKRFKEVVYDPLNVSITEAIGWLAVDKRSAVTLTSVEKDFSSIFERDGKSVAFIPTTTFNILLEEKLKKRRSEL